MSPKYRVWVTEKQAMFDVDALHWEKGQLQWIQIGTSMIRLEKVKLMQYFGETDMNDKEYCAGDIVKVGEEHHVLEFPQDFLWTQTQRKETEILGNIYQNTDIINT